MRELVQYITSALVDESGAVEVEEIPTRRGTVIEVRVPEAEIGRVIGRQGRTARAMRTLLDLAGRKRRRRYWLEIVE